MASGEEKEKIQPIEIAAAVILSIAALLTSWSSFQSALWSARQDADYAHAEVLRVGASTAALDADSRRSVDVILLSDWLSATASGDLRLADFYRQRFPPDLHEAFEAWAKTHPFENPKAPPSPFAYGLIGKSGEEAARSLNAQADAALKTGREARRIADAFEQATVYLAITLFFGGILQVFNMRWLRVGLLAVAVVTCVLAIVRLFDLPLLRLD
jgi:hypothetical protein